MKQIYCVDTEGDITKYKPLISENNDVMVAFEKLKEVFDLSNDILDSDSLIEEVMLPNKIDNELFDEALVLLYIFGAWFEFGLFESNQFKESIHNFNEKYEVDLFAEDLMLIEEMLNDKDLIGFSRTDVNGNSKFEIPNYSNDYPNIYLGNQVYHSSALQILIDLDWF